MMLKDYNDAQAHAYRVLNKVNDMAGDERTKMAVLAWEWVYVADERGYYFVVKIGQNRMRVFKRDDDMFDNEWYQATAEEITAWLLLQKDVLREK